MLFEYLRWTDNTWMPSRCLNCKLRWSLWFRDASNPVQSSSRIPASVSNTYAMVLLDVGETNETTHNWHITDGGDCGVGIGVVA